MAGAVAYLARERAAGRTDLNASELVAFAADIADLLAPDAVPENRRGEPVHLSARLRRASETERPARDVFEEFWSGAFALESVPCAFYAFLRAPRDPVDVLRSSLIAGHDVDTIAAMAGNLGGAFTGMPGTGHPDTWLDDLQDRDRLIHLADGLFDLAQALIR